jgi:hypothetical protein
MNAVENIRPFVGSRLAHIADGFAMAVAVSLPWSSSATSLLRRICGIGLRRCGSTSSPTRVMTRIGRDPGLNTGGSH